MRMGSLQGPVVCPSVRAKLSGFCSLPMIGSMSNRCVRTECWGLEKLSGGKAKTSFLSCHINTQKCKTIVHCSFDSSSNDGGSTAENFNEKDEDYVNTSVIEAVEVKSGRDGFIIKMRDGKHLRCVHNNPNGGHLPDYSPHPAIVLKMEDGTGLLLPIIVLEMPSVLLMAAVRNVPLARPTLYQVVMEMIDKMGYQVRLVRVTRRVHEAYFAQLYLTKVGNESECRSFDLRPSDAINIAVRCKVPIQVHKFLVYSDGVRVVDSGKLSTHFPSLHGRLFTEMDRPNDQPCAETEEFNLLNNMLKAVVEERYQDAALWRDKLNQHRSGKNVNKRYGIHFTREIYTGWCTAVRILLLISHGLICGRIVLRQRRPLDLERKVFSLDLMVPTPFCAQQRICARQDFLFVPYIDNFKV